MSQAAARIRPSQDLAADRPAADPSSTASLSPSRSNAAATFQIAAATAIYTILSIVFFGRPELRDMRSTIIGGTADPAVYLWSIAWWPYAISRGINPFISHVVWTPYGENLVWRTAIPGVSLLSWPLTAATNPIVTYNL